MEVADCVEGKGPADAVSLDKFPEASTGTAPAVRSLGTPLCERDIPSSETSVLRSVLKKPSGKLCLESLQVSVKLHFLKQTKYKFILVQSNSSEMLNVLLI